MMGCELDHWEPHNRPHHSSATKGEQSLDFLSNHFTSAQQIETGHDELADEEPLEEEQEEENFNYLRLDTIEEEEDGDESDYELQPMGGPQRCKSMAHVDDFMTPPASRPQAEPRASKRLLPGSGPFGASQQSADELLDREPEQQVNGTTKTDTTHHPQSTNIHKNTVNKCDNNTNNLDHHNMTLKNKNSSSSSRNQQPLQQPLPSTNRLISEHQARQQQALFRALAERQKMLDELGCAGGQRLDLMSAAITRTTTSTDRRQPPPPPASRSRVRRRRRQRRQREPKSTDAAVPLSSVDLSQMSDRMLDELLGQIASASSSSLSSNGESIDSSDQSPGYTSTSDSSVEDDLDSSGLSESGEALEARRRRRLHLEDAPNVVGIHEDERAGQGGRRQANCREAHRRARESNRRDRDEDESDPRSEHELAIEPSSGVSVSGGGGDSSVAVAAGADPMTPDEDQDPSNSRATPLTPLQAAANSQLEQYFTSGLVKPHQFQGDSNEELDSAEANADTSVEEVLARMLEALNEIGPNDQEHLNELLEKGFAHLELLLNCNLGPTTGPAGQSRWQQQQQQPGCGIQLAHKLLANQHQAGGSQTLLSKDSDYGSDTQSADCLSHEPQAASTSGDSPQQQMAAALMKQQHQQQQQQRGLQLGSVAASRQLSPLAVELCFKLAESLQRLAQQQASSRRPSSQPVAADSNEQSAPTVTPRRAPMKSVVLLNATPSSGTSRPSSSLSGGSGPESGRNWTPVGELQPLQQVAVSKTTATTTSTTTSNQQPPAARPNFTTRVNLVSGEVSSVIVAKNVASDSLGRAAPPAAHYCDDEEEDYRRTSPAASSNSPVDVHEVASEATATANSCLWNRQKPPESSDLKLRQQSNKQQVVGQQPETSQHANSPEPQPQLLPQSQSQSQSQSQQQVAPAAKWRSPRSSMRRKPTGGSFGKSGGHLRPGSPLPRLQLEEQVAAASAALGGQTLDGSSPAGQSSATGQRQLQRALILAQKYNYSPAKLAASKLSHKLQLKNLQHPINPATESNNITADINVANHGLSSRITGHKEHMEERSAGGSRIELDISYFAKSGSLTVHVIQCSGLAAASKRRNTSNPYIKLYLLPDRSKSSKRKSSVHRNELEPRFDERFTFGPMKLADFEERTLWLSVCHKDRLGRNEVLCELLLPLIQVRHLLLTSDLCQSTGAKWYELVGSSRYQHHQPQTTATTGSSSSGFNEPSSINKPLLKQQPQEPPPASGDVQDSTASSRQLDELKASSITPVLPTPSAGINVYLKQGAALPQSANQAPITGQLFVALKFVLDPSSSLNSGKASRVNPIGELHVMIKEAHNISGYVPALASSASQDQQQVAPPSGSLPNPFCKCYLLNCTGQRLSKQKTPHLKRTVNPRWDHKCVFGSLRLANLPNQAIEIQMYNRDSVLVSREYLGGIRLCSSGGANQPSTGQSLAAAAASDTSHTSASDSVSIASSNQSAGDGSSLRRSLGHLHRDSSSNKSFDADSRPTSALCSERESRLWNQMLARPNIWVYGELTLRYLHPLIPKST